MTIFRSSKRGLVCLVMLLVIPAIGVANPKKRNVTASADSVFRAAQRAAAGHRISMPQDEGLKNLTDSGEEIKSFQFLTTLPGVRFPVVEEISVTPLPDGTTNLEVFFHKGGLYVPSANLKLRILQLQDQLDSKLALLAQEESACEREYEVVHSIDLRTYVTKEKEIANRELEMKEQEIEEERQAKIADVAGMPTSSFTNMDAEAQKFFDFVEQQLGKTKTTAP